jgi:hypothetical protein
VARELSLNSLGMESPGKIVEFRQFDTAIDANIVKTKLDAHGIPCFLTEENMANLYPAVGFQLPAFRVRLHLLSDDVERATGVLDDTHLLQVNEEVTTICPRCQSTAVHRDYSQKAAWRFLRSLFTTLVMIPIPALKVNHCTNCGLEFN